MNALVMGGNRFFGKRLVSLLLARGFNTTIMNRGNWPSGFGNEVKQLVMDRKQLDGSHSALRDAHWDFVFDQVCYDAHDARLACEIFRGKVTNYIFTSTQSVYPIGGCYSESDFDPARYAFAADINTKADYAEAKRQAEAVFFQPDFFSITAVRFAVVMGEDDYTERLLQVVKLVQAGKAIFIPNLDARISFIHAEDAARFLNSLVDKKITGPVNCASPEPISLRELMAEIERALGKKANVFGSEEQGQPIPIGIEADWYMSTQKLQSAGFVVRPIKAWLPALIRTLATSC